MPLSKTSAPDVICMVDNCYGEFVETNEPSDVGADMMVGSLIKNPGGGLAPIGGYIVGTKECVENAAYRLTTPGTWERKWAPALGVIPVLLSGLFPGTYGGGRSLKGRDFCSQYL